MRVLLLGTVVLAACGSRSEEKSEKPEPEHGRLTRQVLTILKDC